MSDEGDRSIVKLIVVEIGTYPAAIRRAPLCAAVDPEVVIVDLLAWLAGLLRDFPHPTAHGMIELPSDDPPRLPAPPHGVPWPWDVMQHQDLLDVTFVVVEIPLVK